MSNLDKDPQRIGEMFSTLAARYDRANRVLSLNQDKKWRNAVVDWANPPPGSQVLDLCTGTGDLALAFAGRPDVSVTGLDISPKMLELAVEKSRRIQINDRVKFEQGNCLELPYPDQKFDIVTISFGLRNLPDYERGLREMHRVLKPKGQMLVLEFSLPSGMWGTAHLWYLRYLLPYLGGLITGHQASYRYLDESIRDFPGHHDLSVLMQQVGFQSVSFVSFIGGIALIHRGIKP